MTVQQHYDTMRLFLIMVLAMGLTSGSALAQHDHAHSPYAGDTRAEGTVLTPDEIAALRNGEGMGFAKAAELNHWPGPRHVLELAGDLGLGDEVIGSVQSIFDRMQEAAIAKGEEIIGVEGHLAAAFASGAVDAERVKTVTGHLGTLRGELQAIHLLAHLETRALMSDEQVAAYDRLQGYTPAGNEH